jgi:serine/threonine protein kinase
VFPSVESHRALKSFEIQERLGSGGVGQVFLAKSKAGRLVAIKVLVDGQGQDEKLINALVREAQLCARLTHPAIVQARAFIEDEGFVAIVFDYVKGLPLSRLMRFCSAVGARLPDRIAWHVVERVLSALAFAHSQTDGAGAAAPIVHRDVSPSNVLVDWTGDVKLTDFGIAKMLGVSPATQFGLVKGTLGCMAPEQARGEPVDERADVYAAGLLAWRLATGRQPFANQKEEIELLRAMRRPRIKPLAALRPDLPDPLVAAVASALAPDPQDRIVTAEAFAKVVRQSVEVGLGKGELAELLGRWRGALERSHPRTEGTHAGAGSSANQKYPTLQYEHAATLDDDPPPDGPTVETHALPGDEQVWAALAMQGALDLPRVSASPSDGAIPTHHARAEGPDTPLLPVLPLGHANSLGERPSRPGEHRAPAAEQGSRRGRGLAAVVWITLLAFFVLGALGAWLLQGHH